MSHVAHLRVVPALARDHRFPALLDFVAQSTQAGREPVHQPRNMAVLRIHVRRYLLRVENEQCLIFDEPFLVLT